MRTVSSDNSVRELQAGHCSGQRDAETVVLGALSEKLGMPLVRRRIFLHGDAHVDVDGASEDLSVLVKVSAHQGTLTGPQTNEVMDDVFKLLAVAATLPTKPRLILCLSDHAAACRFTDQSHSWRAHGLATFGVTVEVLSLPGETATRIRQAQQRQNH